MIIFTCTKSGHPAQIVHTNYKARLLLAEGYTVVRRKVVDGKFVKSWKVG